MPWVKKDYCLRGHNIAEVGRYDNGQCRACHRENVARYKAARRPQILRDRALDRRWTKIWNFIDTLTDEELELICEHLKQRRRGTG